MTNQLSSPLLTADFEFDLPPELIPSRPNRGSSRLMVINPDGTRTHDSFSELDRLLSAGDLLVLNDTRVLRARLRGHRMNIEISTDGHESLQLGGAIEALMLEPVVTSKRQDERTTTWTAMLRPGKRQRPGQRLEIAGLKATVAHRDGDLFVLRFAATEDQLLATMEAAGELPLPPYLGRTADRNDDVDYQTVFASKLGAVAAPTAGLHFSEAQLDSLAERGITNAKLTLHVGPGTFRPVNVDDAREHSMGAERYEIPQDTAETIARTKRDGGRVIAVGTTVTRTLEGAAVIANEVTNGSLAGSGRTDIFIAPGHSFKVIDGLITNFHLPRSTLLMLVAALIGRDRVLEAYAEAVQHQYNFYSYGDAMLVWPPSGD